MHFLNFVTISTYEIKPSPIKQDTIFYMCVDYTAHVTKPLFHLWRVFSLSLTKLDVFLPRLFVNTKIHKSSCFTYSSTAPGESGICHDAKEEIFSKMSKMRACSMKKRHSASSWRNVKTTQTLALGPRRDSSLLAAPSFLEFSMLSGRFTQTWGKS